MRAVSRDPLIWQTSVLKFYDSSLADVKAHLEQHYGVPVAIDQPHWNRQNELRPNPHFGEVHKEIRLVLYMLFEMSDNRLSIFCRNLSTDN